MWFKLFKPIDTLIDSISMYRLLLYCLLALLAAALGLSAAGVLHFNALDIAASAGIAVAACWIINKILAYIFDAPINPESSILTGLILSLILPPTLGEFDIFFLLAASGLAMASKYIIAWRGKHIFNPAAAAVVLTAIGPRQHADWWVGTAAMLPFVLATGLLLTRKVRRGHMVIGFLLITTLATALFAGLGGANLATSLRDMALTSPVFYLAFVMLTEPYSSPATRSKQLWYAALAGVLVPPQVHVFNLYSSPEIALVIGNAFAYIVGPKAKLFLHLHTKTRLTPDTLEFAFVPDQPLNYKPGQYMEWTLPHGGTDGRGVRRYFTLASSPTESGLKLGVKFYPKGSSYKSAMLHMDERTPIVAAQLAGDFVLPDDPKEKLAFIAGGIGITPFRSMIKFLVDTGQARNVRLLYSARTEADFAYRDIFETARQAIGLDTRYIVSDAAAGAAAVMPHAAPGRLSAELIAQTIPDYGERTFYVSGTHDMTEAVRAMLLSLGVSHARIKTDFFPGYV